MRLFQQFEDIGQCPNRILCLPYTAQQRGAIEPIVFQCDNIGVINASEPVNGRDDAGCFLLCPDSGQLCAIDVCEVAGFGDAVEYRAYKDVAVGYGVVNDLLPAME